MKLRIHRNNLRLRLSQSEVARLSQEGSIEDRIGFPDGRALTFRLESGELSRARFEDSVIRIAAPRLELRHWMETDQEGIVFEDGPVSVAIEKDFQCLHKAAEESADAFPNPMVDKF